MAAPNPSETRLLSEFRNRINDVKLSKRQESDMELLRWIRARENNLDKAEEMLRKSLQWRAENKTEELLTWEPPEGVNFPYDILGSDKENSVVCIRPIGLYDISKLANDDYLKEMYFKCSCKLMETLLQAMEGRITSDGTPVSQIVAIFDFCNISARDLLSISVAKLLMEISRNLEANYPEIVKATYFINASRAATALFTIIKPILSQRTMDKFRVFGTNSDEWRRALQEQIPLDQLPIFYGGTRKDSPLNSLYNIT